MFNKSGDPSQFLWHAIRQIIDWRVWLEYNRDYTARTPTESGLGLEDITPGIHGLIIIGGAAWSALGLRSEHPVIKRAKPSDVLGRLDTDTHLVPIIRSRI
jgi:hypothetical protein